MQTMNQLMRDALDSKTFVDGIKRQALEFPAHAINPERYEGESRTERRAPQGPANLDKGHRAVAGLHRETLPMAITGEAGHGGQHIHDDDERDDQHQGARDHFDAFPPGARREYLEWITSAKAEATRAKRIAEASAWIAEGKKRNWKYENC